MEAWLNNLLCLNASEHIPRPPPQLPHPSDCKLYFVERDTLFSYHKAGHLHCLYAHKFAFLRPESAPGRLALAGS